MRTRQPTRNWSTFTRARRARVVWPVAVLLAYVTAAVHLAAAAPAIAVAARAMQPGELLVLTIRTPDDAKAVEVRAFGTKLPAERIDAGRWRALAGIDLGQPPGPAQIVAIVRRAAGVETIEQRVVVRAKKFPTRRLTVDPDFVNPPGALRSRIERETALLHEVYAGSAPQALWTVPFVRPVPGAANSRFGTRSVFNGEPRNPHGGADFMSGAGTPVHAPNAGRIALARDLFFSGNTVVIDHGGGVFSLLAHLSRIDVHEGDPIARGAIVGLVGATGRVTGPHLHWALRVGAARVDPLAALALLGGARGSGDAKPRKKGIGAGLALQANSRGSRCSRRNFTPILLTIPAISSHTPTTSSSIERPRWVTRRWRSPSTIGSSTSANSRDTRANAASR